MVASLATQFAPAERAAPDQIQRQVEYFAAGSPLWLYVFNAIPDFLMVLNWERQIIFANHSLLAFLGQDIERVSGLRPGEALNCVHAFESDCGCGTTQFCRNCGAVNAILACQRGQTDTQECRILTRVPGEALDLRVWASPLQVNGDRFTVFAVADISHEKRRRALERIFFHDVMNTATGLHGFASLLHKASPEELDELKDIITRLTERLIDEISIQREIMAAENDELIVHPQPVVIEGLLQEIVDQYSQHPVGRSRSMYIDDRVPDLTLFTDRTLLRRVLGNMVKNALEACLPGETVTLGCEQRGEQVEMWVRNPSPMPLDVQLQVFQRSFSTKGPGRGLGTYSMKLLGERYLKGRVTFSSGENGTVFKIRCPLVLEV